MPLQGKKLPEAATCGGIQRQGMARSSCAVRVEPLEGMLFLTDSGSTRSVQRDSHYIPDNA
jgi:hypothetical protein